MHRVFERILTGLMPSLRQLASGRTADRLKIAKRAIWMSYTGLADEADRLRFRDEFCRRAIEEEKKARTEREKLFWRGVAQYVSASLEPKG
jgi:hypothetical protein